MPFKSLLLASAVGLGVFSASSAFAQQVSASAGVSPSPAGGDTYVADGSGIITLADASVTSHRAASSAADADMVLAQNTPPSPPAPAAAPAANPLDHLGDNFFTRFWNYEKLEWHQAGPPSVPGAPSTIRDGWPAVPQSSPPMPFTDWPYGGTTLIGDNRTGSADSPLMVALAPSGLGKWLSNTGIQAYGWVDVGANISTSTNREGNAPAAYDYNPNTVQMDQAVLYVERTPDTVQTDHIDWGFRLSAIYGTDYHYTTAYGIASYQLLKHNLLYGYDFPMVYGELYIPKIADGLIIRVGRYISLPDIEAQLAPNNYMYSHSITYTFDNYTNEGIQATLALTKNVMLQLGVSVGSEAAVWHMNKKMANPDPNPLYPNNTMLVDPGAKPSLTGCARFQSNSGHDNLYLCADAINDGVWGYNNLQWYGITYYHKFNDKFHVSVESYNLHQNGVPNANNPIALAAYENGGTPFSPQYMPYNGPGLAYCKNVNKERCDAVAQSFLTYWNYQPTPLDNLSLRLEYYDDAQGQRTGTPALYYDAGIGWQHWLSPQIETRPEFTYYWADHEAFNGNAAAGIPANKKTEAVLSGDIIVHF
jgi:hypothetical protein